MRGEAEFWVVALGFGRGEEDDFRAGAKLLLGEANEFAADAVVLMRFSYGEIGKVAAEGEIGDGARDANEGCAVSGGAEEIGVGEHRLDACAIIDWPPLRERSAFEKIDKRVG